MSFQEGPNRTRSAGFTTPGFCRPPAQSSQTGDAEASPYRNCAGGRYGTMNIPRNAPENAADLRVHAWIREKAALAAFGTARRVMLPLIPGWLPPWHRRQAAPIFNLIWKGIAAR